MTPSQKNEIKKLEIRYDIKNVKILGSNKQGEIIITYKSGLYNVKALIGKRGKRTIIFYNSCD